MIYKFRIMIVLQIISIITKQLKHCPAEQPYLLQNDNVTYLTIGSANHSK